MIKKNLGFFLLAVGLLIIFLSLYSSYNIFTGKKLAPEIFKIEKQAQKINSAGNIQEQMNILIGEKIKEILPVDFLIKFFNLTSWGIFAWILILGGSTISGIGIKLLKSQI